MIPQALLFFVATAYVIGLVLIAWWSEPRDNSRARPLIYSLTLAVYCSSWTFFGAVGTAVESAWAYLPIYIGPFLLFVFGQTIIKKMVYIGSRQKTTSIADFIGTRYGKRQILAALVTFVAVVSSLPYIALQLKAVSMAWHMLVIPVKTEPDYMIDTALVTAIILALFAMMFGTRHIEGRERNRGMMTALSLESVVKLLSLLAIAVVAVFTLFNLPVEHQDSFGTLLAPWTDDIVNPQFITTTLLSCLAIICLPRQFHVMVVEYQDEKDIKTARWVFPLYLLLVSVAVLPIALTGQFLFGDSSIRPDTYILQIPNSMGMSNMALFVFLGGFSAATGMVIVAAITLAIMVSNEIVLPLLLRLDDALGRRHTPYFGAYLKWIRRICLACLMGGAWLMSRHLGSAGLASIGLLSFAAFAQLAPALLGAIFWRKGHAYGVYAGLICGFSLWCYCLLLPALGVVGSGVMTHGPLGLVWLNPHRLFGLDLGDSLTHGVLWSLGLNTILYVAGSLLAKPNRQDEQQANYFVMEVGLSDELHNGFELSPIQIGRLKMLLDSFVSEQKQHSLWRYCELEYQQRLLDDDKAPIFVVRHVETLLSGVVGASSAHRAIQLLNTAEPLKFSHIAEIVDGTSAQLQFNQDLLHITVETMSQGICVVDGSLNVVAWNKRYEELFGFPPRLLYIGCPIEHIYRYNAKRGVLNDKGSIEEQVARRLELLRSGGEHQFDRQLPCGTTIQVVGKPMPNGGFVTTFTDISDFTLMVGELEEAKQTLEQRVKERTQALTSANTALAAENQFRAKAEHEIRQLHVSKTRFMQTTSHDLLQPISAARLFVSSLRQHGDSQSPDDVKRQLAHADQSLDMAEHLIGSLREISRLESGKIIPKPTAFSVASLLEELAAEFAVLAQEKNIAFCWVNSSVLVESDRYLLRRILQNFLSNALHYTRRGKVLLGCRRVQKGVCIQIWDTGPGISETDKDLIFNEFERLNPGAKSSDKGMGLGLTIAQGMAQLLDHKITVQSQPGLGSMFSVCVPYAQERVIQNEQNKPPKAIKSLSGLKVLCIDNEANIIEGMVSFLSGCGCLVTGISQLDKLEAVLAGPVYDVLLLDYHLNEHMNGLSLRTKFPKTWQYIPTIVISADTSNALKDEIRIAKWGYLSKPVKTDLLCEEIVKQITRL